MSLVLFDLVFSQMGARMGPAKYPMFVHIWDIALAYILCLYVIFYLNTKCDPNRLKYMRLLSFLKNRRIEMVTSLG